MDNNKPTFSDIAKFEAALKNSKIYSDDLGWFYSLSDQKLLHDSIDFKGTIINKNGIFSIQFSKQTQITQVKQISSLTNFLFNVVSNFKLQDIKPLFNILKPRPFLFDDETVSIQVYYKDKPIKSFSVPVTQKNFYAKNNQSILNKNLCSAIFNLKQLEAFCGGEEVVFKYTLEKLNPTREFLSKNILENFGKELLRSLIPGSPEDQDFAIAKMKENDIFPRSFTSFIFYVGREHMTVMGQLLHELEKEDQDLLDNFVKTYRQSLFNLEKNCPLLV